MTSSPLNEDHAAEEFPPEVVEFLEKHCDALEYGKSLTIPENLLELCPDLPELVNCLSELDSIAIAPRQDPQQTYFSSPSGFSSSMMQQLPRDFGAFSLEEELGRGGMGVVYKARHRTLENNFALKMIRTSEFASEEEIRRFYQEARAASRLRHPNIVSVHDAGEQDGLPYLVMTYIDGQTLADRFDHWEGNIEIEKSIDCMIQIAMAVNYLHEQGIVHRDLKPSNILIDKSNTAFVTDFGLVKVFEGEGEGTVSGTILGTPAYMAPEQAWGKPDEVTSQSDLYSLGAILYQLLTGRPPYDEQSPLDQMLRLRDSEPMAPSKVNPGVSRALEQICLRCLEKKPENRYSTAAALADDLQRFQHGEPISVQSIGPITWLRRWMRRSPALAVHWTAFVVIAVIVQVAEWQSPGLRDSYLPVMITLGIWASVSYLFQKLMTRGIPFSRRMWIAADVILFTVSVSNAEAPIESLVTGYALLIVASSMWYRPKLVAVTTIASIASYGILHLRYGSPETPAHYPYIVIGVLTVIGAIIVSLVRRIRQLLAVRSRI